MQRRLEANWQHHLVSAIRKGAFMITPELALGMGGQISQILNSTELYQNSILELSNIPVYAYDDDDEVISDDELEDHIEKDAAVIVLPIKGTMLKYGTLCTYGMDEIAYYIKHFATKENVSGIVLDIDSGGGAVNAVPPLLEAIAFVKSLNKPIVGHCDAACSAAYWTASACDRIFANNDIASTFGSIGVMMQFLDVVPYYEKEGCKFHSVYSDLSGDKNQAFEQLLKGEYEQIKTEMLNPMAVKFQEAVKANRGDKLKADTKGLLTGATFTDNTAIAVGLADQFGTLQDAINYVNANAWARK